MVNNHYSGGGYGYGYHPMMYPGFGMGYGYSNGLVEGLIIGNMMHTQGTVVYSGGGYNGNALLYPDGRVVDQNGYQVGLYQNGAFTPMQGGMVAQPAPVQQGPTPVLVESSSVSAAEVVVAVLFVLILLAIIL